MRGGGESELLKMLRYQKPIKRYGVWRRIRYFWGVENSVRPRRIIIIYFKRYTTIKRRRREYRLTKIILHACISQCTPAIKGHASNTIIPNPLDFGFSPNPFKRSISQTETVPYTIYRQNNNNNNNAFGAKWWCGVRDLHRVFRNSWAAALNAL